MISTACGEAVARTDGQVRRLSDTSSIHTARCTATTGYQIAAGASQPRNVCEKGEQNTTYSSPSAMAMAWQRMYAPRPGCSRSRSMAGRNRSSAEGHYQTAPSTNPNRRTLNRQAMTGGDWAACAPGRFQNPDRCCCCEIRGTCRTCGDVMMRCAAYCLSSKCYPHSLRCARSARDAGRME